MFLSKKKKNAMNNKVEIYEFLVFKKTNGWFFISIWYIKTKDYFVHEKKGDNF
jgi:hypothetical protein